MLPLIGAVTPSEVTEPEYEVPDGIFAGIRVHTSPTQFTVSVGLGGGGPVSVNVTGIFIGELPRV